MGYLTTIELHNENMTFSAGHYTIFSATHRERMHGHNFNVYAAITASVVENGMAFDYAIYKKSLRELCQQLNNYFLIAGQSPHQTIKEDQHYFTIHFHEEKIPFLKKDALILPVKNISVEELSKWFVEQLTIETKPLDQYHIQKIIVKVYTRPGQSGSFTWQRDS